MADIRREGPADAAAVRRVNESAFERGAEADLVDLLRAAGKATVSLVAVEDGEVVGHILFSPVTVASAQRELPALGLAPMAVMPPMQRRGIGSLLVGAGLAACRAIGHRAVFVLGHPEYYPRFGFVRASSYGISWEHEAPDEAFMALELVAGALRGVSGVVRFQPEFGSV
jgi:putative acetyltransferase